MSKTIVNPETGRKIKVGSRIWQDLINRQILDDEPQEDKTLYESSNKQKLEVAKDIFKAQNLGRRKVARIQGGRVVKANKRINNEETTRHSAKSASRLFNKIKNGDVDIPHHLLENDDKLAAYLEKMILHEMIGGEMPGRKVRKPTTKKGAPKYKLLPKPDTTTEFETTTAYETDEESDTEEDSD